MSYPAISQNNAIRWWKDWKNASKEADDSRVDTPGFPKIDEKEDVTAFDWIDVVGGVVSDLEKAFSKASTNIEFEKRGSEIIHRKFPESPALMDPDFWSWIAIVPGKNLILQRYPFTKRSPIPDILNFCKKNAQESLFFRLWVRSEISFNEKLDDPYEYTKYGDVEFWRSHTFRQKYTESWNVFAAFAKFQYPNGPDSPARLKGEKEIEIREFVKALKRSYANINSDVLSEEQAYSYLENEWAKISHKFGSTSDSEGKNGTSRSRRWFSFSKPK